MATLATVEVQNVFDTITITLDHSREMLPEYIGGAEPKILMVEGDIYRVHAVNIYQTSQGGRVGDSREWSFRSLDEAKAKANGYFAHLVSKGWKRIR